MVEFTSWVRARNDDVDGQEMDILHLDLVGKVVLGVDGVGGEVDVHAIA